MADLDGLPPSSSKAGMVARAGLQAVGGAIPFAGGLISAAAGAWGEHEQERINNFFHHQLEMLKDEWREKEQTLAEIGVRLELHDEEIAKRVDSKEFQSLMKKALRDWAGTESEEKRVMVRNLLANAAQPKPLVTDDVLKLFVNWIKEYSELHFAIMRTVYRHSDGITRAAIWDEVGTGGVREDSAEADLFKLIMDQLTQGRIIRQHREKDIDGNFIKEQNRRNTRTVSGRGNIMKSAFADDKDYELTELGKQFIHYVMNEIVPRLEFKKDSSHEDKEGECLNGGALIKNAGMEFCSE